MRAYPCRDIISRLREYGFEIDRSAGPGSHSRVFCRDNPEMGFPFYCADPHDEVPEKVIKKFAKRAGITDWRELTESEAVHKRRRAKGPISKPCP